MLVSAGFLPEQAKMVTFAIIVVLLAGLALALLRLLAVLRRESRRARQQSLASLVALLRAPEKATRLYALDLLSSFPLFELSVVEAPLRDLLKDPEPEVRAAAGRLLSLLHAPEQLLRQLKGRRVEEKLEAVEGLASIGGEKALSALLETAGRAPEETVRQAARAALARAEGAEAFAFLLSALSSADPILRASAWEVFHACGARALAPLLTAARDPKKSIRARAAELIGDLSLQEGQEALASLLSDPVDEVRAQAASALGRLPMSTPTSIAVLVQALSDSSTLVREEAANSLARLGDPAGLPALLEFLRRRRAAGPCPPPSLSVMQFIGQNFPTEVPALSSWKSLLDSADDAFLSSLARVMEQYAEGLRRNWLDLLPSLPAQAKETLRSLLVRLGRAGLKEPFRSAVYDRSPGKGRVRTEVARLLGEIGSAEFGEEVFALLSDADAEVRREAAWAAGRISHFATIDGLCQALSDPDAQVRMEAARSLTHLIQQVQRSEDLAREVRLSGVLQQVEIGLLQAVNDPANTVRAEVAKGLGSSRLTAAIPSLVAWALGDENAEVRTAAATALIQMPSGDVLPLLAEALSYKEAGVRARAAELLGPIGDPGAVPHLIRSLQDEAAEVREKAGRALWEIGSAGRVDSLLVHLQSPDPRIRASIAGLLGKVKAEEALDGLAHLLRDPNEFVRAAVVNALMRFGPSAQRHLPALIERLEDHDAFVRRQTIRALFAVGEKDYRTAEALVRATRDADSSVCSEAVGVLLQLATQGVLEPLGSVLHDARAWAAAQQLLARAEPANLRLLLARAREAGTDLQTALLGLLAETMKSIASVEEYRQDLASVDAEVRIAALDALSLFASEEAAQAMAEVLGNDPVARVRQRAAILLGRMPGEAAQAALRRAAEQDLEPEVRETARAQIRLSG